MLTHSEVQNWMEELKDAWEAKDPARALKLFTSTNFYYERPFTPGTTPEQIASYWSGIVDLQDVRLSYDIVAVEGNTACVHWENWYREAPEADEAHLDGMFVIIFNDSGSCTTFRQWWFME